MIEPDIDAYGGFARGSALADYLELLALTGRSCTRAQLENAVQDLNWTRKRPHRIVDGDDLNENEEIEDDDLMSHVQEAFDCLDERVDILGLRYPFLVDAHSVSLRPGTVVDDDGYVALLCLTTAHAYGLKPGIDVTVFFEDLVADVLESRKLLVARVGELARSAVDGFPETLAAVGHAVNIPTSLREAPFTRYANDMGADVIGHLSWSDKRLGRWTFVCQVTCGDSDSWRGKMSHPSSTPGR